MGTASDRPMPSSPPPRRSSRSATKRRGRRDARAGLSVLACDGRGRPIHGNLARWLERTVPRGRRGVVSVALVSDARVRALNRSYRQKDCTTDVLSFPANAASPVGPSTSFASKGFLGDIVIAQGLARRQAAAAGHSELTELRVLALHGMLHLLGYDHEHDTGEMARVERRLRARGGLREGLIERR